MATDNNYEELTTLIKYHLNLKNLKLASNLWRIQESPLGGRGIYANCDIKPGEIILIDHPMIIGPRAGTKVSLHCVLCSQTTNLHACSQGCGLPVCSSNCEQSAMHQQECELIRTWSTGQKMDEISMELFRGLTPLRAFFLDENQRRLLTSLLGHKGKQHGFEVDLVKQKIKLDENDEEFMRNVCCVLDSNAFETRVNVGDSQTSLKGLYPLSSLLNHSCTPNTTHLFDNEQKMIVKASVPIKKDSEILNYYTALLWSTASRRHHLATTKHFWCQCERCKDPREFGACLNGLKCISQGCQGVIFPLDPLDNGSKWQCELCHNVVTSQKIGIVQSGLGGFLKTVDLSDVGDLMNVIQNRLPKVVPVSNQIAIELKNRVVWSLGHTEKYSWSALTIDQLCFKEELCKELLQLVMTLQLGQCKLRGLMLYELYRCQLEKCSRTTLVDNLKELHEDMQQANRSILEEVAEILANDISAPKEIVTYNISENVAKYRHIQN